MNIYQSEQEQFWAGEFGDEYIRRNESEAALGSNISLFVTALRRAHHITSCIEYGANIGLNLRALKTLYPDQEQYAIEINETAARTLAKTIPETHIFRMSVLEYTPQRAFSLALCKGILIHIHPNHLPKVYESLVQSTNKYLLICEYYNPTPVQLAYRGHKEKLFKRDFCGELLDAYPHLELLDYGFVYRRDPNFPQDDINWFLLAKRD